MLLTFLWQKTAAGCYFVPDNLVVWAWYLLPYLGPASASIRLSVWGLGVHPSQWSCLSPEVVRRRQGRPRMRWLNGITDSLAMNLSKFWYMVKDREAWHAAVHGVTKFRLGLATEQKWSEPRMVSHFSPILSHVLYLRLQGVFHCVLGPLCLEPLPSILKLLLLKEKVCICRWDFFGFLPGAHTETKMFLHHLQSFSWASNGCLWRKAWGWQFMLCM